MKWRNRAQKRLKSLVKKLETLKIVNVVSDESSSHTTSFEKSKLSVASSSSSSTFSLISYPCRQPEDNDKKKPNPQIRKFSECELDEPVIENVSTILSENLNHTDIDIASSHTQSFASDEKVSCDKTISEKSYDDLQCTKFRDVVVECDDHRYLKIKLIFSNYMRYVIIGLFMYSFYSACRILNFNTCEFSIL